MFLYDRKLTIRIAPILIGIIIILLLIFGIPFIGNKTYDYQLENLKNSDYKTRLYAITQLSSVGGEIVPSLLSAVNKEDDILFKVSIIQIFGNIKSVSTIDTLITHLKHDNWEIRFYSAESLGKLNDSKAVIPLKNLIKREKDKRVNFRALLSLGAIDNFNDIEFLESLLKENHKYENYFKKEIKKIINQKSASHDLKS